MTKTDVSNAKFRQAQFSKGYLRDSNFDGADFTNAIVDRANFKGSTLRGTIFNNAVLTATSFEGANVENADFTGKKVHVYYVSHTIYFFSSSTKTHIVIYLFSSHGGKWVVSSDAYIGQFDIRNLCKNPTLKGENPTTGADTRLSANCND